MLLMRADILIGFACCWSAISEDCPLTPGGTFASLGSSVLQTKSAGQSIIEAGSPLQDLGGSGCTAGSQCGECQGDCDRDTDCKSGLKCFQRDNSNQLVPGCAKGGSGDVGSHDYCYDPAKALQDLGGSGCTASSQCGVCQGDCDRDTDCKSGLKCFQRDNSNQLVPGCPKGGSGDVGSHDYCYDPKALQDLGGSGCTASRQCGVCQGDCDRDTDCKSGLKCFQRDNSNQLVPGCAKGGSGDVGNHDYCYDPADVTTTTQAATTPAPEPEPEPEPKYPVVVNMSEAVGVNFTS